MRILCEDEKLNCNEMQHYLHRFASFSRFKQSYGIVSGPNQKIGFKCFINPQISQILTDYF
jgi:hypothetical protein